MYTLVTRVMFVLSVYFLRLVYRLLIFTLPSFSFVSDFSSYTDYV